MSVKSCGRCKEYKMLNQFSIDRSRVSGLANTCRDCRKSIKLKYRQENKTKISNSAKLYRKENHHKFMEYKRRYNTEKRSTEATLSILGIG